VIDDSCPDWETWLRAARVTGIDATRGPCFSDISHCHDAALAGQGVALGKSIPAVDDLAAGRLVKPFTLSFPVHGKSGIRSVRRSRKSLVCP
jgi:LysR family transcriptional regulator, glycine cleavage system transcriptional activator